MENQNRIQALFNKQIDNQESPNSQLADNITNIQQFTNKPPPYDLQLNYTHKDIFLTESLIINQCLEDQLNSLQGSHEACNDNNQEIFLEFSNKDFIDKLDFLDDVHLQETNSTPYSNFNESHITKEQINESTNNIIKNHMIDLDKEGFQDACDFLEDQSNHLKRAHKKCIDSNEEMIPYKKFKPIQEELNDGSVDEIIAPSQVQRTNKIIQLNINQTTKVENLEEVLQTYKKNGVFNSFILGLNSFVDELISLTTKELEEYEFNTISIDDAIEKLKLLSALKNKNKKNRYYYSLSGNKNTFDFYSTLSKDNKISKYIYCLFIIFEDIGGGDLQKYFQVQELIPISNKILSFIDQFFNEDTCNMHSKVIALKNLLSQVPHIKSYSCILDRPMLKKYGIFFMYVYKTSILCLSQSISQRKQIQDNELQSIKYINYRKFDIETLIIYYREKNIYDHLIDNLCNFTNQIIIEMKKEMFPSEQRCLYNVININSVIEEVKMINAIKKENTQYKEHIQRENMKSLAKENTKENNFYTTFNPNNRVLNFVSTVLGIVEIIDNLDKKIPEDKIALGEILENSRNILHYFFNPNSLTNEKIIELKSLLFQVPLIKKNRSIFNSDCIKQYKALTACIYEISIQAVNAAILSVSRRSKFYTLA